MSRFNAVFGGVRSAAGWKPRVDGGIVVDAALVLATVQALEPGLAGAVDTLLYDMVTHHRLSVGKHNRLPGKRSAQQWWFSRSFRHASNVAKKGPPAGGIGAISAESFAAAQSGQTFGGERFRQLEFGADITAADPFAMPIGKWAKPGKRAEFLRMITERSLSVTKTGYLVKGRTRGKKTVGSEIVGLITKRRREKPVLGFYPQWESIAPKHLAGLDKIAQAAVSGSEREVERVMARSNLNRVAGAAFTRAYAGARAQKLGPAAARQVARAAASEARKVSRGLLVDGR